jgi:hypothetical protein
MNQVGVAEDPTQYQEPWDTWGTFANDSWDTWTAPQEPEGSNWLTIEEPSVYPRVPLPEEDDRDVLPSVLRWRRNMKKGKCPHGYRFYHAEAQCWSCDLETTQLDLEFQEAKAKAQDLPDPDHRPPQDPNIHEKDDSSTTQAQDF